MESIQIIFQLLFFMFCLVALGEPWRIIIRKFAGIFKSPNALQILVLDVYLGSFPLYVIAVIPLHLFSSVTLYLITMVSVIVDFWLHRRKFRNAVQSLSLRTKFSSQNHYSFEFILVVLMFLFSLFIQTSPFNRLLFGSVRDTSIHSLFVKVIIENKQVPETVYPYSTAGIVYPQGFSVVAAFSTFILNYLPPQAIFYLTALFNALVILGAYFLGKESSTKWDLGLSLAFVFAFVAFWPKYVTWGSNAFVASFPYYFICLSLFPFLVKNKLKMEAIFVIGFLFGYLSVLHLQLYETLIASLFILWLYIALKREKDRWGRLFSFIAISGISLLVLSPFVYRALVFYPYPYHNIGLPADVEILSPHLELSVVLSGIKSLFEGISINTFLRIASLVLFFISVLMIVRFRRKDSFKQTAELTKLGAATLLGQSLIFLLGAISPYDLPFYPQLLLLYFPFYFFIAALIFPLYHFIYSYLSKKILSKTNEAELKTRKLLAAALSLSLLLGIFTPFLYQSIVLDVEGLLGSYSVFSVTTGEDLQLLLWIRDLLPRNSTILVNTFQSGTFIPSIADRKVVFPPSAESCSISYQRLVTLLEENVLNATTFNLMKHFNITHIYVGAGVSPWDDWAHKWNPKLFLGNPNFKLVKNFGDAYLFELSYRNASIVFMDDFEYMLWNQSKWQTLAAGSGIGNVSITTDFEYDGSRCLRITAQVIPTAKEWKYAQLVRREMFVLNNSRVTLSFYFNATEGFDTNNGDTFAVLISDVDYNQSIVITTHNGIYKNYKNAIWLDGVEGFFGDFDLSGAWGQMFNSSLPNPFILEFVNYDFDGIENVAYVDNIMVTSTPFD